MSFSLVSGQRVKIGTEVFVFRRKLQDDKWQLENELTGEYRIFSSKELRELYSQKILVSYKHDSENAQLPDEIIEERIMKSFADYPEKSQNAARLRLKFIKEVEKAGEGNADAVLASLSERHGMPAPSIKTVQSWSKILKKSGNDIRSLIPRFDKRGNGNQRYPDKVVELAMEAIGKVYLTEDRYSVETTLSILQNLIDRENLRRPENDQLPLPGRKFIDNLIEKMDVYEVYLARYGKQMASIKFRQALQSGELVLDPLDRVEFDHTILDALAVDEKTFLVLGRPTLTVAIDRCTRCVLGYHIGYDPPSYLSVMKCLRHAIAPKDYVREKYPSIVNSWQCWGLMSLLVVDNGREFHGKALEQALLSLMIDIRYCPVRKPWFKGAVERFFRSANTSLFHTLPGTTFSNIQDKGDYQSLLHAAITERDLHELIHKWICDVYHQTVSRSTLRTPASLWRERIRSELQVLPDSLELLDINLFSTDTRKLWHYGIEINNLTYNNDELSKLLKKRGKIDVTVKFDTSDLGYIYVLDEVENYYIKVECTWFSYASGLSLWLHKKIRQEALAQYGKASKSALNEAKAKIKEKVAEMLENKKLFTRKRAARAGQSLFPQQQNPQPYSGTDANVNDPNLENEDFEGTDSADNLSEYEITE